ncbi:MAG: sn-glycerol-1-phosphate dehydrogenase [Arachnia sp.]
MSLIQHALESADETRAIEFGHGALARTGRLFKELFPDATALVVADDNTFAAAGAEVLAALSEAGVPLAAEPFVLPGTPTLYGDYVNTSLVRERLAELPGAVACSVASGTLNDITKLASGELGRPYLNVCTAASVDGFSSYGASISVDGFKITRDCPAPAGLVADLGLMAAAPTRLTSTGYGDLIEKIPAGADWILADELGVERIDEPVWELVQGRLRHALARPEALVAGDEDAVADLAEGNLLSGLAMQAIKSSRPASGAGHQFSHTWEMEGHGLDWEPPLSHGFKVGVGTVASLALWEEALRLDLTALDVDRVVAQAPTKDDVVARIVAALPEKIRDESIKVSLDKHVEGDDLRRRLLLLQERWDAIRARAAAQLVAPGEAADMLRRAGAPNHPGLIGIDWDRFRATHHKAHMIRSRYTVLELLWETGTFDEVLERLFAPDGFWGAHRAADSLGGVPVQGLTG